MTPEVAEKIGLIVDDLENMLHGAKIPLAPQTHLDLLRNNIREVRDELAAIIKDETGENPWETNPLNG